MTRHNAKTHRCAVLACPNLRYRKAKFCTKHESRRRRLGSPTARTCRGCGDVVDDPEVEDRAYWCMACLGKREDPEELPAPEPEPSKAAPRRVAMPITLVLKKTPAPAPDPPRPRKKWHHRKTRATFQKMQEALRLRKKRVPEGEIAKRLGISRDTLWRVLGPDTRRKCAWPDRKIWKRRPSK